MKRRKEVESSPEDFSCAIRTRGGGSSSASEMPLRQEKLEKTYSREILDLGVEFRLSLSGLGEVELGGFLQDGKGDEREEVGRTKGQLREGEDRGISPA